MLLLKIPRLSRFERGVHTNVDLHCQSAHRSFEIKEKCWLKKIFEQQLISVLKFNWQHWNFSMLVSTCLCLCVPERCRWQQVTRLIHSNTLFHAGPKQMTVIMSHNIMHLTGSFKNTDIYDITHSLSLTHWIINQFIQNWFVQKWIKWLPLWVKPGSHCAILATIWLSETNFENPKRFL